MPQLQSQALDQLAHHHHRVNVSSYQISSDHLFKSFINFIASGAQLKALLNQDENEDIDLDQAKGLLSQLFKTAKKLLANVDEETLSSLIDDE